MNTAEPWMVARHIRKRFAGVQALRDVTLTLCRAEIRCLAGENGCGKSTLIKVIAGVCPPDSGEIVIDGVTQRRWHPIDAMRSGIQVIYQDFSLFPNLTVAENIALNAQLEWNRRLVRWREVARIAQEAIDQLGIELDPRAEVAELSVAGKQLVSIARALVQEVRVIIMDEPTTALTRREIKVLFGIVQRLQRRGVSILFVSHKLNEVLELSEQITVLRNGQKVAEGSVARFDPHSLVSHMTGRTSAVVRRDPPANDSQGQHALQVEGLTRRGRFHDIHLTLHRGEIVGLCGLLGSGRTSLARALFGLEPAAAGRIFVDGIAVACRSVPEAIRHGIAYLPEDRLSQGLFLEQSIERNLAAAVLDQLRTPTGFLDRKRIGSMARRWIDLFRIQAASVRDPVQNLSGGNQQKIVLAKWLAIDAKVLILNGPTVGVDVGAKADIHEKIINLARGGLAVMLLSDDLPELVQLCDRILIMHQGRLIEELGRNCDEATLTARLNALG